MAEDEAGTLAAFRAHFNAIEPVVLNHGGRIVKTTGDGLHAEFPTAASAVNAAIELRDLMRGRNEAIPQSRRMLFRAGVNLGDVVVDEVGELFGDSVNVAVRVESLADPGGIAVTDAVFEAIRGTVAVEFTHDGEHELKNIPRPVRVWKVGPIAGQPPPTTPTVRRTVATVAVLPFDNMSGDADQEYFADGIAEDLLTALSHDKDLAVVARNSTFAYKGAATDVRTLARELDATYVVEGSVRKAGNRVRVTAQLVDAETGHHLWAERYDRDIEDIFDLQDELVEAISTKLRPTLWDAVGERRTADASRSFDAWDLTIRGRHEFSKYTVDGFLKSIELSDRARQIEPGLAAPVALAALAWMSLAMIGWRGEEVNPWQRGQADAEAAYLLDNDDYHTLYVVSAVRSLTGRPEEGIRHARRMIELNPLASGGYHMLGNCLDKAGGHAESITALTQAWRLGRHEPSRFDIANDLAHSHYMAENYDAAAQWGEQAVHLLPDYL